MLAGLDRAPGDGVARIGRCADRDGVERGIRLQQIVDGLEARHTGARDSALADQGRELEARVLRDHRKMLILGDLADADDGNRIDAVGLCHVGLSCQCRKSAKQRGCRC
jgi:hypothetical protein